MEGTRGDPRTAHGQNRSPAFTATKHSRPLRPAHRSAPCRDPVGADAGIIGAMIRNVVMGRLRPSTGDQTAADRRQLTEALAAIELLDAPGRVSHHAGLDVGLRDGGWTFAITNDWIDADAYRAYDLDPEHGKHRAAIVEVCEQVARVQFEIELHA